MKTREKYHRNQLFSITESLADVMGFMNEKTHFFFLYKEHDVACD